MPLPGKDTAMKLGVLKIGVDIATVVETQQILQQKFPECSAGLES